MGSNGYFADTTNENDAWDWDDVFFTEAFNGEDFQNFDWSIKDKEKLLKPSSVIFDTFKRAYTHDILVFHMLISVCNISS